MVLPGAQALLGFGAVAVLTSAFQNLAPLLKTVHAIGLCFITLAIVLLMTPAAYHRIAERGSVSARFPRVASRLLLAAMAALAPGLAAAVWLVFEQGTGSRTAGITAAITVVIVFYTAWFVWPSLVRRSTPQP